MKKPWRSLMLVKNAWYYKSLTKKMDTAEEETNDCHMNQMG